MSTTKKIITPDFVKEVPSFRPHGGLLFFESPCKKINIIIIEKCSKTSISFWCEKNNWQKKLLEKDFQNKNFIVVLRDPLDRWISGFAEYLLGRGIDIEHINEEYLKIFLEILIFDNHTCPQYKFLIGLKLKNIIAIDFNKDTFNNDFTKIMKRFEYECKLPNLNISDKEKINFHELIKLKINSNNKILNHFYETYSQDYWLRYHLLKKDMPKLLTDTMVKLDVNN